MQSSAEMRPFIFDVLDETPILEALAQYSRAGMRITFAHAPIFAADGAVSCTCGRKECAWSPETGGSAGKHPIGKGWQKTATGDLDVLRDQLARIRFTPSLGIVLGEQPCGEYLIAVDVDDATREGELAEQFGALPVSLTCHSARGRRVFFRLGEGQQAERIKNVTGLGGTPGVDVKGQNGFVVIAPSTHPAGVKFRWELASVAALPPEWYLAIAAPPKPPVELRSYTPTTLAADKTKHRRAEKWLEAAVTRECAELSRCQKGQRNTVLFTTACNLLRAARGSRVATGRGYVLRELERAATAAGLSKSEIGKTLDSADETIEKSGEERGPKPSEPSDSEPAYTERRLALVASDGERIGSAPSLESSAPSRPDPTDIELILDELRKPAAISENVARLLGQHPAWKGGPAWDDFRRESMWPAGTPFDDARRVTDIDYVQIQGWLLEQPFSRRVKAAKESVLDGIDRAAKRNTFDSLTKFVETLPPWDGVRRPLWKYFGADESNVAETVTRRWFIGAIARALRPGCSFGGMLILEGMQESYKNRGLEALFGADFSATMGSTRVGTREADQMAASTWCLHDDEMKSKDADLDQLKSFVTRSQDSYRPPYGRHIIHVLRRCVLVGSTNRGQYLHDEENRRFWPLRVVRRLDVDGLARDRLQLFAEAYAAYLADEPWWIAPDEGVRALLREEQSDRLIVDPIADAVRIAVEKHPETMRLTTHMIATWLGVPSERADRAFEQRVGRVLRDLGYSRRRLRVEGLREYCYEKLGTMWTGGDANAS